MLATAHEHQHHPLIRVGACSLDDDVEELVPVCWLEPRQHHGKALYFLDNAALYVESLTPALVRVSHQIYL